ncbi:MAG: hypothetical protein ABJB74_18450 [Gemmatimonas sp.]
MLSQNIYDGIFWVAVASCAVAQIFILRAVFRVTPSTTTSRPASAASSVAVSAIVNSAPREGTVGGFATNSVTSSPEGEVVSVPTPHRLTEIVWVVLPVALLVLAFVGAWRVMHPVLPDWLPPGAEIMRR